MSELVWKAWQAAGPVGFSALLATMAACAVIQAGV